LNAKAQREIEEDRMFKFLEMLKESSLEVAFSFIALGLIWLAY